MTVIDGSGAPPFGLADIVIEDDRIVGVDSLNTGEMTDIMYMKIDHVVEMIRGKEDTEVRLKVEPAGGAPGTG